MADYRLHGFAERFARRGEEANAAWRSLNYLFDGWLKGLVRGGAMGSGNAAIVPAEGGLHDRLLAAASLDRYLQSIAREQIYGTQSTRYPGEDATRGRYDRDLLTDQLRVAAGTGTLAEQDAKLDKQNAPAGEPE